MNTLKLLALLPLVFAAQMAGAHSGGHGPVVEGTGPNGGLLSSVVNASEADLGLEATQVYIAEVVELSDRAMEVRVFEKDRSTLVKSLSEVAKVIALLEAEVADFDTGLLVDSTFYDVQLSRPSKDYETIEIIFHVNDTKFVSTLNTQQEIKIKKEKQ